MRVIILGGSPNHFGGVETFGDRAESALGRYSPHVSVERLWTQTAYLTLKRLPKIVHGLTRLASARMRGPAVVWLQYVNLPDLIYLFVARVLRFSVIVTPHLGVNWASQRRPFLRELSRALLGLSDRIALISRTQTAEIAFPANPLPDLIRTFLPYEVLETADYLPSRSGPLHLIHATRLSEAKGTFLAVDVMRRLREAGVTFTAEIIGAADEPTSDRLSHMIAKAGLGEAVSIPGWMPPADLMERLRGADVLIHLSRTDSYPLIVLEALAAGVLPLVLDLPGARDIVETYDGCVVPAATAVDEAAAFLTETEPADLRRRAAIQSARVREDFAWDKAIALLQAVMDGGGSDRCRG